MAVTVNGWERFAQENAEFFIWGKGTAEEFFSSGREDAAMIFESAAPILRRQSRWGRAVEIGAGTGRLALPMAVGFREVVAVDVSPTMLETLRTNASRAAVDNVRTSLITERWDEAGSADFVYSWTVFQHLESWAEIEDIVGRIALALAPGGAAGLQFDTRPTTLAYRLRAAFPDPLLPKVWRKSIRRIRRRAADLDKLFDRAGLVVSSESQRGTPLHLYILVRA
jgi:SAM-dependent methyltransferase